MYTDSISNRFYWLHNIDCFYFSAIIMPKFYCVIGGWMSVSCYFVYTCIRSLVAISSCKWKFGSYLGYCFVSIVLCCEFCSFCTEIEGYQVCFWNRYATSFDIWYIKIFIFIYECLVKIQHFRHEWSSTIYEI